MYWLLNYTNMYLKFNLLIVYCGMYWLLNYMNMYLKFVLKRSKTILFQNVYSMLGGSQASRMMNKSKTTLRPNQKRKTLADIISTNKENKKKPEQETFDLSFDKIADDVELIVNEFVGCVGYIYPEGYVTDHGNLEHLVKKDTEPEPVVEKKKAIVETPTKQKPMMKVTPAPIMNIDYMQILREIEEKNQQKEAKKVMQKLKREKKKQLEEMQLEMLRAKMATEAAKELETLKTTKSQKKVVEATPKPAEALPSTSSEGGSPVKKRGRGRPKKTEAEKEETRQKKQIQVQVGDSLMMCDVEDGKEPSSQSEEESEEEDSEKEDSEEETQYKPEDVSLKKKRGRPSKKQVPIQIGDNVMLCDVDEGEQEVAELDEVRAVVNEDQEMEGDGEFEPKVKVEKLDTCEYLEPDCIDCKMCDARFGSAALLRSHVRSEHLGIPLEKDLPLDTPDGIVEDEEEDEDVEYVEEEEEEEEENVEEEDEATDQEVLKKLMKKQKKEAKKAKKRQRSGGDKEEKELQPKKRRKKSEKVLGKELKKQKLEEARLAAEANEGAVDDALNSTLEDSMVDGEQPEGSQAQSNKEKKERKDRKKKRDSSRVDQKRFLYPPFTVPEECAKGNAVFDDQGTVKSFVCHFCERTIKVNTRGGYLSVYKEHIKTHTQEKEFKCPLCDYESHREREVRKHVSRKHEDVDAEELVPRRSLQARPISIASGNYVTPLNSITMTQDEIDAQEEEFLAKTLEEPLLQRKRGKFDNVKKSANFII